MATAVKAAQIFDSLPACIVDREGHVRCTNHRFRTMAERAGLPAADRLRLTGGDGSPDRALRYIGTCCRSRVTVPGRVCVERDGGEPVTLWTRGRRWPDGGDEPGGEVLLLVRMVQGVPRRAWGRRPLPPDAVDPARGSHGRAPADLSADRILATVSHELRTPLNAILGWVGVLRECGDELEPDTWRHALQAIDRAAQAQRRLVDDLLDHTRSRSGRLSVSTGPVKAADVVETARAMVTPWLEREGLTLDVAVADRLPLLEADPERLQQVLLNLLDNARKYAPPGSTVRLRAEAEGGGVAFRVSDQGRGIPSHALERIFRPFERAEPGDGHRGLGLGLSLVREVARAHGGHVRVDSPAPGAGATFSVVLPPAPDPSARI